MSLRTVFRSSQLLISRIGNCHPNSGRVSLKGCVPIFVKSRCFATESAEDKTDIKPKYFQGKKIVEEEIDPYTISHLLLSITGYDAAVLDSYTKFIQTAAKMTDVNISKSFNIQATTETFNVRKSESQLRKDQMQYNLKKHQRIVQLTDLTEDKIDILLDYVNEEMPCGVQMNLELKKWEELVAPNHPSLQKMDRSSSRYQQ